MPDRLPQAWQEASGKKMIRAVNLLLMGCLFCNLHPGYGQDQRVADSLVLIYQEGNLEGEEKMELLKQLAFNELNDGSLSLCYAEELIGLAEEENNRKYLFSGYLQKGEHYKMIGDSETALEAYFKAVSIAAESNSIEDQGVAYVSIADVYAIMENYPNAERFYGEAIQILRSSGDSIALASALLNAGDTYYNKGDLEQALRYFEESGPIFDHLNYTAGSAYNLGNLGMIHAKQGKDDLAKKNINEAIAILEELEDFYPISVYLTIMSEIYLNQNDLQAALDYTYRSLELATAYGLRKQIGDANLQLSKLHEQAGNEKEALAYYKTHILYRDSIKNVELVEQMADMRTNFEVAQKQIEVDLLTHKQSNQRVITLLAGFTSLLFILLALGLYLRNRFIKKTNVMIRSQRDEIELSRDELEAKRDLLEKHRDLVLIQKNEIIESITYAQKIQAAMLPPESNFSELLKDHFIFYKPRDIVSGDFYWIKQVKQRIILVAADCTGHGVPGALMSMLGMSYLNEIVQRREITEANQILYELRHQIKYSLRQQGKKDESKDGIDMALCVLDLENMKMQCAGANSPIYVIKDVEGKPQLREIRPDRMPLGYYPGKDTAFDNHDVLLDEGDHIYLFSDGFIDQKGGRDEKKFLSKNFKQLLLEIHDQPMPDQKNLLEKTLADWMGDQPQIDDLLILGVKV